MLLWSCESVVNIKVAVLWEDDLHFSRSGSAHIGILQGKWDSDTGFDATVLDTGSVIIGVNSCYCFTLNASDSDNYTAFIYFEQNEEEGYDEGYDPIVGYKYNRAEPGTTLEISVSAFY